MTFPAYDSLADLTPSSASASSWLSSGGPSFPTGLTFLKGFRFDRPLILLGLAYKRPFTTGYGFPNMLPRLYDSSGTLLASGSSSSTTFVGTSSEQTGGIYSAVPFDSPVLVAPATNVWFGWWLQPPLTASAKEIDASHLPTDAIDYSPGSTLTNVRDGVVMTCHSAPREAAGDAFPGPGGAAPISADPVYQFTGSDSVGILIG